MTHEVDAGLYSGHIVLNGDTAQPPPTKKKHSLSSNFRPMSGVAKRLDG